MNMTEIFEYIDSLEQEMVKTLGELISFPSYRRPPEPGAPFGMPARKCLDRALEICRNIGLKTKNIDGYAGLAQFGDGEPELGILAHLDVVPEGDGWTREPYSATVEDGLLYGRGAMDDKGPAVSVMYALKALKDMKAPLKKPVELILGTDEECGSGDLEYFKTKEKFPEKLFTPDASYPLINIEKGRIMAGFSADCPSEMLLELHGGRTVNAVPARASAKVKGVNAEVIADVIKGMDVNAEFSLSENSDYVEILASGKSAHASTPEFGENALTATLMLLNKINLDEPANRLISGLCRLFPHGETDGRSAGIAQRDDVSGALTLALSITDFSDGRISGAMDIRFPVCGSVGGIGESLGRALRDSGFEPKIQGVEPHCVPSDSPFVRELLAAYEAVTGIKGEPFAIGGGTYVHGTPGGVAFGCEVDGEDNRIHGADEFIRIEALKTNAKIFAEAIVRVCGVNE